MNIRWFRKRDGIHSSKLEIDKIECPMIHIHAQADSIYPQHINKVTWI
jgi:hypothetical protein